MELINYQHSVLSLAAPALAIVLAIITRKVMLSLSFGIIIGALLLTNYSAVDSLMYLTERFTSIFWNNNNINTSKVFIILFLFMLGIITTLVSLSGGTKAFGNWAKNRIKTSQDSQLLTVFLGFVIFIDDYFNSLAIGNISRPLTDKNGVSRAKLAYLIDSTAAPVCVLTPISSWGAYIIALIGTILSIHNITEFSAFSAFIYMIPMNLYAFFALAMALCVAWMDLNIGPMRLHERRARSGEFYDTRKGVPAGSSNKLEPYTQKGAISDLTIPIITLVIATIASLIITGYSVLLDKNLPFTILGSFENTNVVYSLVYGGIVSLIVCIIRSIQTKLPLLVWKVSFIEGIKSMLPAIYILIFAWVLVDIIGALETGKYLASLIKSSNIKSGYLPMIFFIVSGIMAFATGTSWGTFGIMIPIAGDMAQATDIVMMLPILASVLAGSVFGDHCSPISDTTILSSTGASCHHMDHVITQLPYALITAFISIIGYLVMGLTDSILTGFLVTLLTFISSIILLRKLSGKKTTNEPFYTSESSS